MSPSQITIDQEARALLEQENQARFEAAKQAVAERRERERQAAERAAQIAALKDRLAALQDTTALDTLGEQANAALDAYVAAMAAHNAQIAAIRDELQALGSGLPAGVDLYPQHGGVVIGEVEQRWQRVQGNVSRLAMTVLRTHIKRGEISLDTPRD